MGKEELINWYMGWQMTMSDTKQSISDALQRYYEKYGLPPTIMLVSDRLEEVQIPDDLKIVVKVHRVPKNILLIGVDES